MPFLTLNYKKGDKLMKEGITLGTPILSVDRKFIFHISIIDFLQKYNIQKKGERWFKINFRNAKPNEVSSMHFQPYGQRFLNFMRGKVFNSSYNSYRNTAVYENVYLGSLLKNE